MAKYEIHEPDKEHDLIATADDLIGLINEALRLFREAGGRIAYYRGKSIRQDEKVYLPSEGAITKQPTQWIPMGEYLVFTPPRRETMGEDWVKQIIQAGEAAEEQLKVIQEISKKAQESFKVLSEMPEEEIR